MEKSSTQDFLEFNQIRDGIIILKNKTLRAVLMVSSLNFSLKPEEEQNAILYQFQNFLNSLDFPCQILITSRKVNITGYLDELKEIKKNEKNELLKIQIEDYRKFIEEIMSGGSIMEKNFFVIIPFFPLESQEKISKTKFMLPLRDSFTEEEFQRYKIQLQQRVEFVILGLRRCGLRVIPLQSQELIELLWKFYHPSEAESGYYPEFPPELIT